MKGPLCCAVAAVRALRDAEVSLERRVFIQSVAIAAMLPSCSMPESLVCEGRLGIAVDEDPMRARQELVNAVAGAAADDEWLREHPPVLEWWGGQFAPAAISPQHPIVATITGACTDLTGTAPPMHGMPFGADMRLLVNEGNTPTVLFGPGDVRRAHAPDEFVAIDELEAATRALVLTIMRIVGVITR